MKGLYIVSTPIGNREDITIRALRILSSVDIVLCEDTRTSGSLLAHYRRTYEDIGLVLDHKPKLMSYYEENELQRIPEVVGLLNEGKSIALVSDAGTPLISDPGYKLVSECWKRDILVTPIPGPSSVITALSASGLPTDKFAFIGYLPKKQGKRTKALQNIQSLKQSELGGTMVLLETPHRLLKTFNEMVKELGNIEIVVARELTKVHEEFYKGTLFEATKHFTNPKGEFVILI